ncbi:MAG: cupredoxin domain-containing protein [Acidimicrobiales bacterium]
MKILRLVLGALALGLLASACAYGYNVPAGLPVVANPPGPHPKPAAVVVLQHVSFGPSSVTIEAGQTVEWIWRDPGIPHNVTFTSFRSETKTAGVYYHTFTKPGTYGYRCTLHYNMLGEVIVKAA